MLTDDFAVTRAGDLSREQSTLVRRFMRFPTTLWLLMLAMATLMGCTERRSPEDTRSRLVYGFQSTFKTFDPARVVYAQEAAIIMQVQETLVRFDNDLVLKPCLAVSWETPDHCESWVFHLRPGVKFHDGEPFNAAAVKTHFERIMNPKTAATRSKNLEDVDRIETPDELTVIFRMKEPNCIFPERLTGAFASIPSPRAVLEKGDEYATNPVGTGPFRFVEWIPDVAIRLAKNEEHWNADRFHIKELEFRPVRENTTRYILLEQGALDIADVEFPQVGIARKSDKMDLQSVAQLSIRYVGFNTQKPPFSDKRVRQAANYAVNKEEIVKYVFFGVGQPAIGPIPEVLPAFNGDVKRYDYNPEKAKALLAEAGYPNGFDASFWTYETGMYRNLADNVVETLRKIGIKSDVKIYDNAVYWDKFDEFLTPTGERYPTKKGVFDIYVGGWVGGETAHGFLEPLFKANSNSNSTFFDNAEVNRLLTEFKTKEQPAERDEIYKRIQAVIVEEAPWIFAFHGQINTGVRKHVKGFKVNPSALYFFEDVTLEPDAAEDEQP